MMNLFTGLFDKNNEPLNIGSKIKFTPNDYLTINGEIGFACGAYGIATYDEIPSYLKPCGNDNFVSFFELWSSMEDLVEFNDLGNYFTIINEECTECPFNSKCENQDKCKENIDA